MSSDPQLGLFTSPNEVEPAPSDDVAINATILPEAAATVAEAAEATSPAKRRTSPNVSERRKHEIVGLAHPQADERYLSVQDVARRYAVSIQTIWRHTKHSPHFPKPIKILNGSTRWRMSDVLAFEISRQEAN